MKNIACIIGTRPEVIKMAPVIWELEKSKTLTPILISTGQHDQLSRQFIDEFKLKTIENLSVMVKNQTPGNVIEATLKRLEKIIKKSSIEAILVVGDTATAYAGALVGFLNHIPVGHIEAGLRTYDLHNPWPEEALRQMIDRISHWLFAPTKISKANLLSEHLKSNRIFVTGNTIIDTVQKIKHKLPKYKTVLSRAKIPSNVPFILITGHRRENHGEAFRQVALAIKKLALQHSDVNFIYPVHPNPNVKNQMGDDLKNINNVILTTPLGYFDFLALLKQSICIITDSGGVQEEAAVFRKKVILLRTTTERPEGVKIGTTVIVGSNQKAIIRAVNNVLMQITQLQSTSNNPYGDGKAAQRIVKIIEKSLS